MDAQELATMVDAYYEARERRLNADRTAAKLKETESDLKRMIIAELSATGVGSIGGKNCRVTLQQSEKPICEDWAKLYTYMMTHDAMDLLQKRLHEAAVKLRWEQGEIVPGVDKLPMVDLSVSKL